MAKADITFTIELPEGLHFKMPDEVMFYLTAKNEKATKARLSELYKPDTMLYIEETKENIKLEDIF